MLGKGFEHQFTSKNNEFTGMNISNREPIQGVKCQKFEFQKLII